MMRTLLTAGLCLLLPAAAAAEPIQYRVYATHLELSGAWGSAAKSLVAASPPPGSAGDQFDPTTATAPGLLTAVQFVPGNIGRPPGLPAGGSVYWYGESQFTVDVGVTDLASMQTAIVPLHGRAHTFATYTDGAWGGQAAFWFDDRQAVTLGGTRYTLWGTNLYDGPAATVAVWVGDNVPPVASPEPGTLVLAALGLPLAGLIRRRIRFPS